VKEYLQKRFWSRVEKKVNYPDHKGRGLNREVQRKS